MNRKGVFHNVHYRGSIHKIWSKVLVGCATVFSEESRLPKGTGIPQDLPWAQPHVNHESSFPKGET